MDPTQKTCGKIKSAKHWLTRAEQDIGRNATIRGQMDLLLAEAELKSVKETLHSPDSAKARGFLFHSAAFVFAAFLFVACVGGVYLWTSLDAESASVGVVQTKGSRIDSSESLEAIPAKAVSAQKPTGAQAASNSADNSVARQEVYGSAVPAAKEPAVSQDEKQRLIRAAGQSLRGQTKP